MAQKEVKWYDILSILFGIILSIADPITDILTLVEFYRADHNMRFFVGLSFVVFPLMLFSFASFIIDKDEDAKIDCGFCTWWLFGCNPFFPAFMKLRTLLAYLKLLNLWRSNQIEPTDVQTNENPLNHLDKLLWYSKVAVLLEATLESAPQIIIQLYAMVVQQESVSIIQMVSLPVSFLSLAWASIVADELLHSDERNFIFSVKVRVLHFVTYLIILSSRLFAVALFTVSYKWFVSTILSIHSGVITICDTIWLCVIGQVEEAVKLVPAFAYFHWLRDDCSAILITDETENRSHVKGRMVLANVLFAIENIFMILLFYFSDFPHTWYSLPVTICVCLFTVLGAVMRLAHFYFSMKESDNELMIE